jgi:hypothetical protein
MYKRECLIKHNYVTGAGRKSRRRAELRQPLRSEIDIQAALDDIEGDDDELMSRAGSLADLSRWIGEELQTGSCLKPYLGLFVLYYKS